MNICRLCLAKDANFAVFGTGTTALRIMACTSLEIEPGDGLPQYICPACRLRLEEMHCFRRRCHAADRRLRRHKALQRQGVKSKLEEMEEEQAVLQDVAGCTKTACSENNAQWRVQATQLIRSEIDAYKKELLSTCKQAVRADIELELRSELEGAILAEAKKELRLSVLDDVFYELERYFVRKRNETAFDQVNCTESLAPDSEIMIGSNSQLAEDQSDGFYEAEPDDNLVESNDISVVELLDDEAVPSRQVAPTPPDPVPMVEINMNDPQLSHLREEFNKDVFLNTHKSPLKTVKTQSPCHKKVRFESPKKKPEIVCDKHKSWKRRFSQVPGEPGNCVRCRLRGAHKLNSSVSQPV
ncbi:uncharacterized protein LOC108053040 [Drosophila rhopaloa]|uniref:Uncharacterized protein LOC108053040 n=1 Tax=Drosophila rhopaloa TaxID=1041015 RepID=A0A6P4FKN8_DRORH|nr:uncharacterized protein LOC108053040 [Drosophila rhopaloa]